MGKNMIKNGNAVEKKEFEDVQYDTTTQYETVVDVIETLLHCSDEKHVLSLKDIANRCAMLTDHWYDHEGKSLQRAINLLIKLGDNGQFIPPNGGRVVKVPVDEKSYAYYWENNSHVKKLEKALKEDMDDAEVGKETKNAYRELYCKLDFGIDLKNEENWRKGNKRFRDDMALRIKVVAPYEVY